MQSRLTRTPSDVLMTILLEPRPQNRAAAQQCHQLHALALSEIATGIVSFNDGTRYAVVASCFGTDVSALTVVDDFAIACLQLRALDETILSWRNFEPREAEQLLRDVVTAGQLQTLERLDEPSPSLLSACGRWLVEMLSTRLHRQN